MAVADVVTPAGPVKCQDQGWERFPGRVLPPWHLPKVLILQSASARAGADRTFSDQYLGQVPGEEGNTETKGVMECCTCASRSVG